MEIGEDAYAQLPKNDSAAAENAVKVCLHFLAVLQCELHVILFSNGSKF